MERIHVYGIDVSSKFLDISEGGGKPRRIANDEAKIAEWTKSLPNSARVYLEASGGYERLACRVLGAAGIRVLVINPLQARRMMQAKGIRAKTDGLDAKALAEFGPDLPAHEPPTPTRQELQDLVRARQSLHRMAADLTKQAQKPELTDCVRETLLNLAKTTRREAASLQKQIRKVLSRLARDAELIRSVPGAGEGLAATLLAELPADFRQARPEQLASYCGLAPHERQSGLSRRHAFTGPGNIHLKTALYMPALACLRTKTWAQDFYQRLRNNGKSHRLALVALMRKLLLQILAVLKRNSPWTPDFCEQHLTRKLTISP